VQLSAGVRYQMSWWDVARTASGGAASVGTGYRAYVRHETAGPIMLDVQTSHVATGPAPWSERRVVEFVPTEGGAYAVGFQLLENGAVAIANVQLSDTSQATSQVIPYAHTDGTGRSTCDYLAGGSLADRFDRVCRDGDCYFELRGGFYLQEDDILGAEFGGAGIPAGNYNYRHVGVALNAVGSGLVDCSSQGDSCYSNAFVEYDLEHSAFSARVTDYGGGQQCFSFGNGTINRAKTLTAERVMGVPMSSADEQLIAGQDFTKPIFKGRPGECQGSCRFVG
jgi:hypothetical protein